MRTFLFVTLAAVVGACGGTTQNATCDGSACSDSSEPMSCPLTGVHEGDRCIEKGASCSPAETPKCGDAIPPCFCDGMKWSCNLTKCPPCPDPSTVREGTSCLNAGIYANCPGFDACGTAITCTCVPSGGNLWTCGGTCKPMDAGGG